MKSNYTISEILKLLADKQIDWKNILDFCNKGLKYANLCNAYISTTKCLNKPQRDEENLFNHIVYSLKDNFCEKTLNTSCGSNMLKNFNLFYNATIVDKLNNSGAQLIGKCNMDEFSMGNASVNSIYGPVINPRRYLSRQNNQVDNSPHKTKQKIGQRNFHNDINGDFTIAGGSSGGCAVSVLTGSSFFSIGSDTGGSVRNPAAYCGVFGFKPSYGTLSRHGLIPLANSLDVPGIFARNISDIITVYNKIAGVDLSDLTTNPNCIDYISPDILRPLPLPSVESFSTLQSNLDAERKYLSTKNDLVINVGLPESYLNHPMLNGEIRDACTQIAQQLQNYSQYLNTELCVYLKDIYPKSQEKNFPGAERPKCVKFNVKELACSQALPNFELGLPCYSVLTAVDIASNMARYDGIRYGLRKETLQETRSHGFGDEVKGRIMAGNYFSDGEDFDYYTQACRIRRLIYDEYQSILYPNQHRLSPFANMSPDDNEECANKVDILLTPVTLSTAPLYSEYKAFTDETLLQMDAFTIPANLAGIPAISIPIKMDSVSGLPIAIQLMSNHFNEPLLLFVAHVIEKIVGHFPTLMLEELENFNCIDNKL